MDETTLAFRQLMDNARDSSIDINEVDSLDDLYQKKKNELGLSDRRIQKLLGLDAKTLKPILDGTAKQVNVINMIKLAHFIGLSLDDTIKVNAAKMNGKQIKEIQRARDASFIAEYFDIPDLIHEKFFDKGMDTSAMRDKIIRFFELDSLYDYKEKFIEVAFSKTKRSASEKMRNFWVVSAKSQFEKVNNPFSYNREKTIDVVTKIKALTRNEEHGLSLIIKALYQTGVTVIYQKSISKLQVRGASMIANGKPCIVLSDIGKSYPTLWFALLHELYHVLFEYDALLDSSYHLSTDIENTIWFNEEKANRFASEYLIKEEYFKYISAYISSPFQVREMAEKLMIHESIIYSLYCYRTREWSKYQKFIPKMEKALKPINIHQFENESISVATKELIKYFE